MAAPAKFGPEFFVNTSTTNNQRDPVATALTNGTSVVVWTDDSQTLGDPFESSIKARLFSATGRPITSEFLVNTVETHGGQYAPAVAALGDGRFVVAWPSTPDIVGAPVE